ncbi:MAG: hypothetical protein Q4B73_07200 [Lachnospiraceae bacterium]|nr:hypothetical protein [Lachnospiraceae bacterium]
MEYDEKKFLQFDLDDDDDDDEYGIQPCDAYVLLLIDDREGCYALKIENSIQKALLPQMIHEYAVELKKRVRAEVIDDPANHPEYAPYHYVENENGLIERITGQV